MRKEDVKIIGLKKVVGETRANLPEKNPIPLSGGGYRKIPVFGVIYYNRETGELSADFYDREIGSINLSPTAPEGYERCIIEEVVTMKELKDWVYHVNDVPGYEDLELLRHLEEIGYRS